MKYFQDCQTLDQAKDLYRKLCKELHPDNNNGIDKGVGAVILEFKAVSKVLKFKTGKDIDKDFDADKFTDLLAKFEHLQDINISFVGSFIWLEDAINGATYRQKEAIKNIKIDKMSTAKFHGKKKVWFFSPIDYKQFSKGSKTLAKIKSDHGCNTFAIKGRKQIA